MTHRAAASGKRAHEPSPAAQAHTAEWAATESPRRVRSRWGRRQQQRRRHKPYFAFSYSQILIFSQTDGRSHGKGSGRPQHQPTPPQAHPTPTLTVTTLLSSSSSNPKGLHPIPQPLSPTNSILDEVQATLDTPPQSPTSLRFGGHRPPFSLRSVLLLHVLAEDLHEVIQGQALELGAEEAVSFIRGRQSHAVVLHLRGRNAGQGLWGALKCSRRARPYPSAVGRPATDSHTSRAALALRSLTHLLALLLAEGLDRLLHGLLRDESAGWRTKSSVRLGMEGGIIKICFVSSFMGPSSTTEAEWDEARG